MSKHLYYAIKKSYTEIPEKTPGFQQMEWPAVMTAYKWCVVVTYLLGGLEDVTPEHVGSSVAGNVRKYLEILGVMGHVKDSVDGVTHDE